MFRVLQGIGGGALQPMSQAILVESFPREKHGMAMAVYGMGVVVAPVIGPTLGGWITDNYSWRWIFLINLPVGHAVADADGVADLTIRRTSSGEALRDGLKIDYIGFGLLALGLGALEVVLDEGQREDWFSSHFIVTFAVITVVCLVAVVFWELRQKQPVIDFRILKERNYTLATLLHAGARLRALRQHGAAAAVPADAARVYGDAERAGAFARRHRDHAAACRWSGFLVRKTQPRWLVVFGVVVSSAGMLVMSRFNLDLDFRDGHVGPHRAELRAGVSVRADQRRGLRVHPEGAHQLCDRPVQPGAQYRRQFGDRDGHDAAGAPRAVSPERAGGARDAVRRAVSRRADASAAALESARIVGAACRGAGAGMVYGTVLRQSSMLAFSDAFWVMAVLFLAIVPLMFLMKRQPKSGRAAGRPRNARRLAQVSDAYEQELTARNRDLALRLRSRKDHDMANLVEEMPQTMPVEDVAEQAPAARARSSSSLRGAADRSSPRATAAYLHFQDRVSSDDANVDGHITAIAPKIGGNVVEVLVQDNQPVKAGDVLVRIDPRDFQAKVAHGQGGAAAGGEPSCSRRARWCRGPTKPRSRRWPAPTAQLADADRGTGARAARLRAGVELRPGVRRSECPRQTGGQ